MIDHGRQKIRRSLLHGTPSNKNTIEYRIHSATSTEERRLYLSEILKAAHPIISSPVYIGVTNNLNRRLKEHSETFLEVKDYCRRIDGYLAKLKEQVDWRASDFAHRAVAAELSSDNLFVALLPLDLNFDEDAHQDILHSAEWLLNRWYTPSFGRK